MDTAVIAILSAIAAIITAVASILGTLRACGVDISKCLGVLSCHGTMCGKKDIESNSSLRNVSRDSLVQLQQREIFEGSLMTLLRNCLELDTKNSVSILSRHVNYHSIRSEDAALGWGCGCGCGLRNIQMLSSHLLSQRQEAREVLYGGSGFVPNIAALQRWIGLASEKVFGPTDHDFDRRFYGNKSLIGTRECAALLRYFGLRANVVDFESASSSFKVGKRDKKVEKDDHVLTKWVWDYFSDKKVDRSGDGSRVILSEKAPLYFHHDGNSRTIVGIQVTRGSNGRQPHNLLIFDPHINTNSLEESLRKNGGWQKLIKRGSHTLTKPLYQLCYVDPGIERGKELENLKTIKASVASSSSV